LRVPPLLFDDADDPEDELDEVEYFEVELEADLVLTSVPKSAQFAQTCSSAPSTLIVFGFGVSAPHISHWTIPVLTGVRS